MDLVSAANHFWATVTEHGRAECVARKIRDVGPCEGRITAHHVIPKQRLRNELGRDTEAIWDVRNAVPICERHHHLVTVAALRLPARIIPSGAWDFAKEHGMLWSLERDLEPQEERLFG